MKSFPAIFLVVITSAAPLPAADQLTGFPFQSETLHYNVNWPGGRNLGEATLNARQAGSGGWDFDISANIGIPVVPIADRYRSAAAGFDLCSTVLERVISHGNKKVTEKTEFDQKRNVALRQTLVPATADKPAGGGKSELKLPTCARDALTFLYFARREMGQGRVPPSGRVFFGSAYDVKMVYTGAMDIPVAGKPTVTDHLNVSVKGPASDFTFEIFYARDAARTPLLIKIPVSIGTVSLELVR
jgi:hypothetical protein